MRTVSQVGTASGQCPEGSDPIAAATTFWRALEHVWLFANIVEAMRNIFAVTHPSVWLDHSWTNTTEDKESLMRFIYYGGSQAAVFALSCCFWHLRLAFPAPPVGCAVEVLPRRSGARLFGQR
jgi:hypothetical protein